MWETSRNKLKKAFCYQKLFWPFNVWMNCSSDLKKFANSRPSASNFKSFSRSLEQFFLTAGQNNFGNKISFLLCTCFFLGYSSFTILVQKSALLKGILIILKRNAFILNKFETLKKGVRNNRPSSTWTENSFLV